MHLFKWFQQIQIQCFNLKEWVHRLHISRLGEERLMIQQENNSTENIIRKAMFLSRLSFPPLIDFFFVQFMTQ